jgi:hypothetical protein
MNRKMKSIHVPIILIMSLLLYSCDPEIPVGNLSGRLTYQSDCLLKSAETGTYPSNQSCVSYTYSNQTLLLTHFNAGFNCCPETISATFSLQNDTLYVFENESESLCDCNCLYDLGMEVNQLNTGLYVVKMVEPYVGNSAEELTFSINLNDSTSGTYCVDRNSYPWNL